MTRNKVLAEEVPDQKEDVVPINNFSISEWPNTKNNNFKFKSKYRTRKRINKILSKITN